jgi:hypothetical protein
MSEIVGISKNMSSGRKKVKSRSESGKGSVGREGGIRGV